MNKKKEQEQYQLLAKNLARFIENRIKGIELLSWQLDNKSQVIDVHDFDAGVMKVRVSCALKGGGTAEITLRLLSEEVPGLLLLLNRGD